MGPRDEPAIAGDEVPGLDLFARRCEGEGREGDVVEKITIARVDRAAVFLLQGLLVCPCCGYALCGKRCDRQTVHGEPRRHICYRRVGSNAARFLEALGVRIIAVSDVSTGIHNPRGLSVARLLEHIERQFKALKRREERRKEEIRH